jgi:N-methylhydantoinase B
LSRNRINSDVLSLICANSRTSVERKGDLSAQISANRSGIRRFQELVTNYGLAEVRHRVDEAERYSEAVVRHTLRSAPEGDFHYTDYLDDDGAGNSDLPITVRVRLAGGRVEFDFTGTAPETQGSVNATEAVTASACYYVVRCLIDEDIPMNEGAFAPITINAPRGTLVNANALRAVAAGNVETSQRIVDVLLGALSQAFPDRIPAGSQGTMNNLLIGGHDRIRNQEFAYYETICGGAGASSYGPGASAVHTHMTNTRNTPIEALEMHYPLRVCKYAIREESGGKGDNNGGNGVVRSIELLAPAHVSIVSERRKHPPRGSGEGQNGATGGNMLTAPDGQRLKLAGKVSLQCESGTVVTVETPGGGGWSPTRT